MSCIQHDLSLVLEIHRDLSADIGLHLSQTPIRALWLAHQHSRLKDRAHVVMHIGSPAMNDQSYRGEQVLAELIGSRLCHDLVNPLGAIGNGVELAEMTGNVAGAEMELIRDAVNDAQARIRFFRIAFGAAGAHQMLSAREARVAALDLHKGTRLVVDWRVDTDLPRVQAKLAFLMILCAETALPMGGRLRIGIEGNGTWKLDADAARIQMDDALWSTLRFGMGAAGRPLKPSEVQFAALHLAAAALDATVNYVGHDTGLSMSSS